MKKLLLVACLTLAAGAANAACPTSFLTFKDAGGTIQTLCFGGAAGAYVPTTQLTTSAGVALDGTAGTAAAPVLTVQGIASMTPLAVTGTFFQTTQPVSGTFWQTTQPISAASLPLPALASTSTKQSDGTQKTQIVDGSGNVIASTSNNLDVQCANCSGSGVSTADEAAFTAGSSLFAGSGGFFQTTATSNPLTTGQQGIFQMTANRALFTNIRNASGTELATASNPLQVSLANTGSNGTAVAVSAASLPLPSNAAQETGGNLATIATNTGQQGCAGQTVANTSVTPFSLASTTALKLVSKVSAKKVYICSINLVSATAQNVALVEGTLTTTNCDTSTAGLAGGTTAATGWNLAANGGLTLGNGQGLAFKSGTANLDVCLLSSSTGQISGSITWAQF